MEYLILSLFFLLAVLILFNRIKRFLRELYQAGYDNGREAFKEVRQEKEKEF